MEKILIVDDESSIRSGIVEFARFEGYETVEAANGAEAVEKCEREDFDLIIMDVMMPLVDGFSAYQKIKTFKDIPVIMLSAKGEEYDKLYGFELGIEDYVVKPFSLKELMARVRVVLRSHAVARSQTAASATAADEMRFGELVINTAGRWVSVDGNRITMTPKEYDLLFFLASNHDVVFTRDELLDRVWGFEYFGDGRTVDSHIRMLRRDLGPYRDFIVTHRGTGYKFEVR